MQLYELSITEQGNNANKIQSPRHGSVKQSTTDLKENPSIDSEAEPEHQ